MQGKKYVKSSEFGQDILAYISKKIQDYQKKSKKINVHGEILS